MSRGSAEDDELEVRRAARARLEETFAVCPECGAPWRLHWTYIFEAGERKRRWNTCGMTACQIVDKWLLIPNAAR